jgi:methylated-DNA-[protein]-cysteine S-methyltransferase
MQHYCVFETAAGFCGIAWKDDAITCLRLPTASQQAATQLMLRRIPDAACGEPPSSIGAVVASVRRYFEGEKVGFTGCAIDLGEQELFFREVYSHVRKIAWGETTTYGTVAKALGAGPQAARDVGQAMASNPMPLIIPCHRVLAAGGKVGGFSAPGGSNSKARMLKLEGVNLAPPEPAQRAFGF